MKLKITCWFYDFKTNFKRQSKPAGEGEKVNEEKVDMNS